MTSTPSASLPLPLTVAVFNHKGGVAKTTTACNLAVALAAFGYKVVLVDLDMQGNASSSFGLTPLPPVGAFDVLVGKARLEDALVATRYGQLKILPATNRLKDAERVAATAAVSTMLRRRLIEGGLADHAHIAIIDCPPSLGTVTLNALTAASAILMTVRPDRYAHDGLVNTWHEIKRLRHRMNQSLGVAGILLTMTSDEPSVVDTAKAIRAEFGAQTFAVAVPADPEVLKAAHLSLPVVVYDPDGDAGRAYVTAAVELLGRMVRILASERRHLPPPASASQALNSLRSWRATEHQSLLRLPEDGKSWTSRRGANVPFLGNATPESADAPPPADGPRRRLILGILIGVAVGLTVGLLAAVLGRR